MKSIDQGWHAPAIPPNSGVFIRIFRRGLLLLAALAITALHSGCALEKPESARHAEHGSTPAPGGAAAIEGVDMVAVEGGTMVAMTDTGPLEGGVAPRPSDLGPLEPSDFLLGRHEVTWREWLAVRDWAAASGYDIADTGDGCAPDHPVHSVSWYDAVKWCNALSEMSGLTPVYRIDGDVYRGGQHVPDWDRAANGFRLPTEEEWEYAARGGAHAEHTLYAGSNDANAVGWHYGNSQGADCGLWSVRGTWAVGLKEPNELGIHDMTGNVWEWCWDTKRDRRRLRGGSWNDGPGGVLIAFQIQYPPEREWNFFGLRLARNAEK